ncbi:Ribosome maturation factor RimP [Peptoniphilus harei]|uniref:Ribosome maturation factor RimP n=1 Tax=Peptoniphilus harei TaxID=54005 RepID=A0A2X1Y0Q5_9FIRM|nr:MULTISPECIES: ribosome maturation factor RimP [Peptoniphilus]MBS6534390.1 ribosome maturation factor RimP [Peptoniphilus harei]MDU2373696.1 ribosome maturation factor RimP [Peptoniphilus harei]MDU3086474.1 ribosome maturation factor RimP [Peptoniphilus harei]MDU5418455.1 ribosome maturation factor RimP [Peptoniphilus harei]MDU5470488.1 ribosome maturation factor RimP [Peptoniphilus harei]
MNKKELKREIYPLAEEVAEELGYEIVDIEFQNGSKHDLLSIFIYKKEGIDLDDCTEMSRSLEKKLDNLEALKNPYYLEISSPGLDRPLKTKDDYRRNVGNEVDVKLYAPIDGQKEFSFVLDKYDDENIYFMKDEKELAIPIKSISSMKQTIKF